MNLSEWAQYTLILFTMQRTRLNRTLKKCYLTIFLLTHTLLCLEKVWSKKTTVTTKRIRFCDSTILYASICTSFKFICYIFVHLACYVDWVFSPCCLIRTATLHILRIGLRWGRTCYSWRVWRLNMTSWNWIALYRCIAMTNRDVLTQLPVLVAWWVNSPRYSINLKVLLPSVRTI